MNRAWRYAFLLGAVSIAGWQCACSGAGPNGANGSGDADSGKRDTELAHEECDLTDSDAVRIDADNNGRPDIVRVMDDGREVCRAVDINRDSLIDVYVYFDERGQERRREYGFDRDDRPDEIVIYENGQLVRKMRETNNDMQIDTWDFYQGGRLVREERDSTGDGYVDQWWSFPQPDKPKCAVVVSDVDGDGKPDEDSRLDLCASDEAAAPPSPSGKPATAPESKKESPSSGPSDSPPDESPSGGPAKP